MITAGAILAASVLGFTGCTEKPKFDADASKYNNDAMWSYKETDKNTNVDTFFIAPTTSTEEAYNMSVDNEEVVAKFTIQVGNQKGIYDDNTRFFAPVYSQATMTAALLPAEERKPYFDIAYEDVKEAFQFYMERYNNGNGIIIAGSSQGAELALRLVKEFFNDKKTSKQLICCYALSWNVTEEYMKGLKNVHFATGEDDINSIVSFNCELPEITSSLVVGENEKTLCINPLSWKTTTEEASKELNLGCCIYSTKGYQKGEDIVGFCGAYIDEKRGTLKLTGMDIQDPERTLYPSRLEGQPYGVFHIYDWEFFYRNLEANVKTRVASYLK